MSKIKIETLGCYQQVVDVIGVEKAKVELFKVMQSTDIRSISLYGDLGYAFTWFFTPQGKSFWDDVNNGRWPYEE